MRYLSLVFFLFLLSGCNEGGTNSRPYIVNQTKQATTPPPGKYGMRQPSDKVEAAKIKAEAEKEIAKINMEKEVLIQKLKGATEVETADINKEIAVKQVEADKYKAVVQKDIIITQDATQRQIALNSHDIQKWILLVAGVFLLAVIIFVFYNSNRNRKERLKIHQDNLDQELRIKEQEMHVKIAERLIDAMSSGKLSPDQENKLLGAYSNTSGNQLPYYQDAEEEEESEEAQIEDDQEDISDTKDQNDKKKTD